MNKTVTLPTPRGSDGAQLGPNAGEGAAILSFKLDVFEGPLDLLLFLIKRDEIDITDIPISKITSDYLSLLKLMESCDLGVAGEYIVMAATLIRIKSAMLLPRDPEAEDEDDPRDELIQALLEYRKFKEAAVELRAREETERAVFARTDFASGGPPMEKRFVIDRSLFDLLSVFRDILARAEPETFHRVEVDELTVDDRIAQLEEILDRRRQIEFPALFRDTPGRWLVILTLLALLEMARTRRVSLMQARAFETIVLTRPGGWEHKREVAE